ncbi:hypothetical protein QSE00_23860 [Arenibacter sp. M-2]|uniref:hypothetical protein n=1 Tax=Arenibacter sp. M-2 TaxID=3053612 RepID=UPI0025712D36|nr:hypothetical protein [Arenibacter sp. M-2]MDL5514867.1 hypothetical protein [Arenibacter sp. M-2]|tara:strand:+ start:4407 stop:5909 length:1503 start_codon:yes stop_codon:yes gene_type:complete
MSYEIFEYTDDNLKIALDNQRIPLNVLEKRKHFKYFQNYLGPDGIVAKTILVEEPYISKAYLIDYSNYYSICFQDYKRDCKRVHFFGKSFDDIKFEKELYDSKSNFLNDCYLGYIVVKPLPDSIIGPTLLKTYEVRNDGMERFYPSCREYKVNLFGKVLKLKSLVYQEQDTVVAACASVAIWSAFHKTSKLFDTNLPSPSEITKRAGNLFLNYGRTFPNPGLDITQICKAIESTGLVSEYIISDYFQSNVKSAKRLIYAYNRAGLPTLLFLKFADGLGHLITINGYSDFTVENEKSEEISLLADNIEKFYAHDDQVGPFAKMSFTGNDDIQTPWPDSNGNAINAKIYAVIIPVYPKIRIKFQDVFDKVSLIDQIFFKSNLFKLEIEWDVFLIESNDYKRTISESENNTSVKKAVVMKTYPKFIWIGRAIIENQNLFDFIYDSTDIASGYFCIDFVLYYKQQKFKENLLENFVRYKSIYVDHLGGPKLGEDFYNKVIQELQ